MASTLRDTFEPPDTTVRRRRRWRSRMVLAIVVVLLGSAAVVVGDTLVRTCGRLGSGVAMVAGECIGVTDGSYIFRQDYRDVENRIAKENTWVADEVNKPATKSVVTIALFLPMTVEDDSPISPEEVRNQMEGAYTAQHRLNRESIAGDPNPLIRLVLANQGNRQQKWEPVVEQLADMRADRAPLVAVIGLGVSVEETERAAERLAGYNIPMVATLATADALNYQAYPGFVRVAPSNHDQVEALRKYLDQKGLTSAILVEDTNQDLFVKSMKENFTMLLGDLIKYQTANFSGVSVPSEATASIFAPAVSSICAVQPQVVLFAGRKIDLRRFLMSLEAQQCSAMPITVVTVGSDTGALGTAGESARQEAALREANIMIAVAATADPQRWKDGLANPPEGFRKFFTSFQGHFNDVEHLADGEAILTYDALLTAARAIRLAAASKPQQDEFVPSSADVGRQLTNLNTIDRSIRGAGRTLSFSLRITDEKETGNPCGKPIPILETPSGPPVEPVFITCSDDAVR